MGLANSRALWTWARVLARSRRGTGAILAVRGPGRITATGVCRGFQRISVQEGGLLLVCFGDDRVMVSVSRISLTMLRRTSGFNPRRKWRRAQLSSYLGIS